MLSCATWSHCIVMHMMVASYMITSSFAGSSSSSSPNIIFILTDDQDLTLDSMQAMPNVKSLIADKGMTLNNAFATTPVCCPSRTETIAGRQYHNVQEPRTDCQGVSATYNVYTNPKALFPIFHENGYVTGGFGKVTNSMDFCTREPDLSVFDRLHVSCDYHDFFTETYFNKYVGELSGSEERPTLNHPDDIYQTAQLGNASVNFIKEQLQKQSDGDDDAKPFIMWVAPYAPHTPAAPAPWHVDRFPDVELKKTPNYNCDVSSYHSPVSKNPELTTTAETYMLMLYRDRLQALLAVDDMVKAMVDTVDDYDAWDNTYLIYASDHGYHIGQYRLPCEKYQPYEETIRIPLFVRGPDVAVGESSEAMISNIDFLPTFVDLAGIEYEDDDYDGRSIKDILEDGKDYDCNNEWRQTLLFEYRTIKGTETGAQFGSCAMWDTSKGQMATGMPQGWTLDNMDNSWRVLRIKNSSVDWMYGEFVSMEDWDNDDWEQPLFHEFYDLNADEYQLTNLYIERKESYISDELFDELHELVKLYGGCYGADSCSPIGNKRPGSESRDSDDESSEDSDSSDESSTGKGSGDDKGSKSSKSSAHHGYMVRDHGNNINSEHWSVADVSTVLSVATVVAIGSFVGGILIGNWLQSSGKQELDEMPKVL